jgi:hypothetical protein
MTNKMPKTAIQIILGVFLLTFTAVSCNNGGGDKKEPVTDTPAVVAPPPQMKDSIVKDTPTATTRPVKTPD